MIGLIGILLSLALLIVLAYRGLNVIVLAPTMASIAVIFAGAPILATYTQVFMPAMGNVVVSFFPLFLLGALFGKVMSDSGVALRIAEWVVRPPDPDRGTRVLRVLRFWAWARQ
ncbi:hypothetical protein [Serinicoccus marinus]|uniref:GntT/GntP/DsdX family permease n=1 Tax=Serinicoccus marinus TaxID=247333 RepID=UPI0003B70282|nr:hypothetical protein [Serinicoccus marinus]